MDTQTDAIRFTAPLQRKDPRLPVYLVVPYAAIAAWQLQATTVVDCTVNGHPAGRRTVKRWDASPTSDWFVELTAAYCQRAGISVGNALDVALLPADCDEPAELASALGLVPAARAAWAQLSDARRRAIAEHVRGAKSAPTRVRRAALAVQGLVHVGH